MNDKRIVTWLDGELSSDESAQLEAEIAASPNLQADVEQIRAVKTVLQSLPRERAPRNFTLDVNEYGRAPRPRFSLFSIFSGRVMPALALAAVVLLAGVIFTQFPFGVGENQEAADTSSEIASMDDVASDAAGDASDTVEVEQVTVAAEVVNSAEAEDASKEDAAEDKGVSAIANIVAEETEKRLQDKSSASSALTDQAPQPTPAPPSPSWYDNNTYSYTLSGAMAEITGTDDTSDTVSTTTDGSSTWVEALRDLTTGFLILLLIICIFAFGLGMWILVNRHQR